MSAMTVTAATAPGRAPSRSRSGLPTPPVRTLDRTAAAVAGLSAAGRAARAEGLRSHPAGSRARRAGAAGVAAPTTTAPAATTSAPRARTRPSRALPRRTAPPPVPVAEGLAVAGRPWQLTTTGPGLSRAALDDDAPLDVLAGLEARGAAGAAPARLVVRAAQPADLPAVAAMHGRCTGTTLLQRYRSGGRTPSLTALADLLREPLALVVLAGPRQVVAVATARVGERPSADFTTEVGLLVEDGWQARGVGRALARHLGASLRLLGYGQVVTRSATSSLPLARVMEGVGTTRHVGAPDGGAQLTTRLDVDALDGLAGGVAAAPAGALAAR
ncbi:GNAT family N-acetyltransferase [uncultured Pseudokineococcus sp.]|uniref:GNAT family N-acetyltransferase n=1 Tax=uncultured Pseudokineococcus sp. TaxID=1642928 RepID=UPI0026250CAE|nr:hypothetical protein [uncultured Pseudokineococcus sp.]